MTFCAVRRYQHCRHVFHSPIASLIVLLLAASFLGSTPRLTAQSGQKIVQGKVVGSSSQPQSGAIVYLKNTKTDDIKSFISTADGSYRFGQLSPDVDYEIWAEYQGHKSTTKTVSSFDSKKLLDYQLKVDTGK
jgi:Carboxypeptidase regulatory-like domain